jgi:hypothetical protein
MHCRRQHEEKHVQHCVHRYDVECPLVEAFCATLKQVSEQSLRLQIATDFRNAVEVKITA